ncbi:alpha-acetolactate decarboxylase [Aspergillus uvarum CBS 121591]|uniref:Alpha-acetolactate decarboxylase n=1 Tax=Aspergillus uvarum CBS 121591 TaxID=1448315 RepID=A0A319CCJ9_9EURO|nr:alpha-acetolactate decarboxylase [Aspergillus uvarum CBS 121591]PYH83586.1 alpha-acetolactate decarboxylase [Aspergillus uvarum CBS 121591]
MADTNTNTLYQYSTISALLSGICTEGLDASTLLEQGTYGLGTFSDLDGEIIVMNSRAYHFPSSTNATVRPLNPTDTIPFAMLTTFQPTHILPLPTTTTSEKITLGTLSALLTPLLDTNKNTFLSLRLTTTFAWLTTRIIPRRSSPEETLADCASRQKVTNHGRSKGTLFGFWSPAYTVGIGVPGFHLHFLSEDEEKGGHVLDFEGEGRGLEVAVLREVRLELPDTEEFGRGDVEAPTAEMVRGAEGG